MAEQKVDPFDLASGVPPIDGELRPKPRFADRISTRVLLVAFLFVGVLVFLFLGSLNQMDEKKKVPEPVKTKKSDDKGDGSPVPKDLQGAGGSVVGDVSGEPPETYGVSGSKPIQAGNLVTQAKNVFASTPEAVTTVKTGVPGSPVVSGVGVVPPMGSSIPKANEAGAGVGGAPLTPQQQAAQQAKLDRLARTSQARSNGMSAKPFDGDGAGAANLAPPSLERILQAAKDSNVAPQGQMGAALAPVVPLGEQDEKIKFMKDAAKEDRGYHPHLPLPAVSPNELKVGSFIPLVLETGINSDLPGQITARSSEAIYDTVTGCRELIPPMTKFVGRYDSKVALGQGRILVAWSSTIFKDGSELNLAGMQGYDSAGQAGLQSEVDNHYLRLFGMTFGMSMLTAGVQLSVPPTPPSTNGTAAAPSVAQTVATALAQQFGQLGAQVFGKYMNVQPTLRNYPGERFTIMVPHTIVFTRVWSNRCQAGVSK